MVAFRDSDHVDHVFEETRAIVAITVTDAGSPGAAGGQFSSDAQSAGAPADRVAPPRFFA